MAQRWTPLLGVSSIASTGFRRQSASRWLVALLVVWLLCTLIEPAVAQNIDGGRSELPGMKQDIFDQVQRKKKAGNVPRGKGPPDCPKSDSMSPFFAIAFSGDDIFVRLNSTEGKCERLLSVGGANYSTLTNASRTCGPAGEWKTRIAENMSSVFFQGGLDWVKHDNETIEVVMETGTYMIEVSEHKYEEMLACWKYACGCEQANSPITRVVFFTLLAMAIGGLGYDSFKLVLDKFRVKKPPKHVMSPKGHKMVKDVSSKKICDVTGERGTHYTCSGNTNYDMSLEAYKAAKKKLKADWEAWYKKYPNEKKKEKKAKKGEDDGSDDDDVSKKPESEKSDGETTKSEGDKADASDGETTKSEAEDKTEKSDGETTKSEAEDKTEKES